MGNRSNGIKRILLLLLCLALLGSLISCGSRETAPHPQPGTPEIPEELPTIPDETPPAHDPTLVVYFSRVGNTDFPRDVDAVSSASINQAGGDLKGNAQLMAEWMADELDGDLVEIQTEYTYPIDYQNTIDAAKQEQTNRARPALISPLGSLDGYTTVYLVSPIWWSDLPMAVYSFFDAHDFAGKTIVVSVTHGGSGFSRTVDTVRSLEPEADVVEGLALPGEGVADAEGIVRQFIRDMQ